MSEAPPEKSAVSYSITPGTQPEKNNDDEPELQAVLVNFDDEFPHPNQWPITRRWAITVLITLLNVLVNLSTTIVAPSLDKICAELKMDPNIEGPLTISAYVLMLALGPLLLAPFSELWGRVPLIHAGNLVYAVFNLACGFAQNRAQLVAFRVLSGFGSGASPVVGIGMISDLFPAEQRGKGLAVLNMAFILATPIGAIVGGFTSYSASWRYDFYATSAVSGVLIMISALVFRETYPPVVLGRRKKQLLKNDPSHGTYRTPYDNDHHTLAALYYKTLIRPVQFLTTQPIIQLLSLYASIMYGTTYLIFSTFPTLWEKHYGEPKDLASLHFIAPGIGYFIGIQIGMFTADRIYLALKRRNHNEGRPEFRLPLLAVSAVCAPPALFWYGWTAQAKLHWAVPNVAIVFLMCGCTIVFQCVTAYYIDAFPLYAASASGSSFLLRGLCAFGFPLFGPSMYEHLGYGWGNSLLGFLALAVAVPVPLVLWFYGERLRRVSSYTM
ncbi:major facilitator superfamily domain-containing protein [Aspergillus caelatus]|uniref:Major facilitator superfamily domain-containing protein n=1 Tax=Aspergillus caelatus TaxID=61420 RepID=A0A5N6ZS86_9EURO|nr:major facilitator superfamily domain-containing protein [Aspergillus caelatus]KAE8359709.1 major facilitator superfamily domain-containing protein [Aspergillus caelatus]